jgi:two-component system, NarL family, sensor histidine kinase UhpB
MLEDNPLDAKIIQKTLTKCAFKTECTVVDSGMEYIRLLEEESFDVILSDHQLPDFDAVQALQARNNLHLSLPFILITGAVSEEVAIAILKEGADDYILKDRLQRLPIALEKLINAKNVDRQQTVEASLSELTERFQLAAKTSFDIIWDFDLGKNTVYCSDAAEKIFGIPPTETYPVSFLKKFIYHEDLHAVERSLLQLIKGKEHRWRKILRVVRSDGSIAWMNTNALVIRDASDQACRVVGVMHDVTEVRRLQHELIEQEMKSQKQITEITIQAQEKERGEIGKELHDNVNQLLATAKIMIDTARNFPELHDLCLTKGQESIMEAILELRNISHSLTPPRFEHIGFDAVLKDLAYKINLSGRLHLELSLPPARVLQSIPDPIKLAFYRIIQEQVSNILKHAHATHACIAIQPGETEHTLAIEDDGIGFEPQKVQAGIGLKNMESRAQMFNGTMQIISSPGEGCIIRIQVPAKNGVYV